MEENFNGLDYCGQNKDKDNSDTGIDLIPDKVNNRRDPILSEIQELCSKREYYKASELLGEVTNSKIVAQLRKEIMSAIRSAEALVQQSESITDANEQAECCMRALAICADCDDAKEKLQFAQPIAPDFIKADVKGNVINVKWGKLQSQYTFYVLVRKVNGIPTSPTDGEIVCETQNNSIIDTKAEIGLSYYYAVYSKCGNVLSTNGAITTTPVMLVAELSPELISTDIHETYIKFNIEFPNGVKSIDLFRDGKLIKNLTDPSFIDIGLTEGQQYSYRFVANYEDCTLKKYSSIGITEVLCPTAPPKPVELTMTDKDDTVTLSWEKPGKDELHIIVSDVPLEKMENSRIEINKIQYQRLDINDNINSYQIQKDFFGVKYYLPVTVRENIGLTGKCVRLVNIDRISGLSIEKNDRYILIKWNWDRNWNWDESVHIDAKIDEGNTIPYDIHSPSSPECKIPYKKNDKSLVIHLYNVIHVENEDIFGDIIEKNVFLTPIRVNFKEVKSESLFGLLSKDKYSLTIESEDKLPCKLELIISEEFSPINLANFKPYLTIMPIEIRPGCPLKKEFQYTRIKKGKPLFFRLITTDRELAKAVSIVPETREIK